MFFWEKKSLFFSVAESEMNATRLTLLSLWSFRTTDLMHSLAWEISPFILLHYSLKHVQKKNQVVTKAALFCLLTLKNVISLNFVRNVKLQQIFTALSIHISCFYKWQKSGKLAFQVNLLSTLLIRMFHVPHVIFINCMHTDT